MSSQRFSIIAISTLFVLFALGATACSSLPNIASATQPTLVPTVVSPVVAPVTPTPESTPAPAAQNQAPRNARPAVLAAVLKTTGLQGGVVKANNAGTLSVQIRKDAQPVQTNAATLVVVPNQNNAQVSDIRANDRVVVKFPSGDATQPAAFIMVVPSDLTRDNVLLAAVQSNSQAGLAVRTPQGAKNVTTDASTSVIDLSGAQPAVGSRTDLKLGNAIVALGSGADSGFSAQTIIVVNKDARTLLKQARSNPPAAQPTPAP